MGKDKDTGGKRKSVSGGPFGVDVHTADILTVIHLFASHDIEVVRSAIATTHSYCDSDPQVLTMFCEHGIWANLSKLLVIKDYPILDLVIELVCKILSLTNFPLFLLDEARDVFTIMMNTFINNEWLEVLLNTCLIMINIIDNFKEIEELIYNKLLVNRALLVVKTKPGDDLKVNAMILVGKLLSTKEHTRELITLPNYQPAVLLCYIKDVSSPALQQSAIVLLIKICIFKEPTVMGSLYNNDVAQSLIRLISDEKYLTIYFDIIYICTLILDNLDNCLNFVDTEEFPLVLAFYKSCPPEFQLRYVQLLAVLAQFQEDEYRQKLHTYGFEVVIVSLLQWTNWEVQRELVRILINLSTHTFGLDYLVNDECVDCITRMLGMVDRLELVALAVDALHCFLKKNNRMLGLFFERGGVDKVEEILIGYFEKLDSIVYDKILEVAQQYLLHPKYKDILMSRGLFGQLLMVYKNAANAELSIKAAHILNDHFKTTECRTVFSELKGHKILMDKLTRTTDAGLLKTTLVCIKTLVVYKKLAMVFMRNGVIPRLRQFEQQYSCARLIIKSALALFLPLKFHEENRLDISDSIKDNFYILNGEWHEPFVFPEELERLGKCPRVTLYLVDYSYTRRVQDKPRKPGTPVTAQINFGGITEDPYLYDYFIELGKILKDCECDSLRCKLRAIAKYIADQMSGFVDMSNRNPAHIFRIHINCLKQRLGTSMIPIGFLRMGFSCERALLFKVLADYFNIFSALQRDKRAYWNEVALFREDKDGTQQEMVYYVVDLFNDVGELYVMRGVQAQEYLDHLKQVML